MWTIPEWAGQILLAAVGLSGGIAVAAGLFSLIVELGVVADFADRTHTGEHIMFYEDCVALGGIVGNLISVFRIGLPLGMPFLAVTGLLCGIFVGGSNYVSALLCLLVGGLLLLASLWLRRARGKAATLFLSLAIPFLASALAPGNRVRQSGLPSLPPVHAVVESLVQAARDGVHWLEWPVLLLCLAWIPLLFRLAGRCPCQFRWPGAFAVLTFLLFAAQNTPHFYAASTAGPLRLRNIVYLSFYWLLLLNEWYCLGWFRRRVFPRIQGVLRGRRWAMPLWAAALGIAIILCTAVQFPNTLTAGCLRELSNGTAAAYAAERDSRLPALLDPAQTDVRFPPIVHQSPLLYLGDISTDPDIWTNQALAAFYGKASVALYPSRK